MILSVGWSLTLSQLTSQSITLAKALAISLTRPTTFETCIAHKYLEFIEGEMDLYQAIPVSSAGRMPPSGHCAAQPTTTKSISKPLIKPTIKPTITTHENVLVTIKALKSMRINRLHSRTAYNGSDAKISRRLQGTRARFNVASRFFADWKSTKNLHIFRSQNVSNSFWRLMYATSGNRVCHRQWRRSSF